MPGLGAFPGLKCETWGTHFLCFVAPTSQTRDVGHPDLWLVRYGPPAFNVRMADFWGDSVQEMVMNQIKAGGNTAWELNEILQAGRMPQVNFFYGNGSPAVNPF